MKSLEDFQKRVLVVDDNQGWLMALQNRLQELNCYVETCSTFDQAEAIIEENIHHFCITDLELKDEDQNRNGEILMNRVHEKWKSRRRADNNIETTNYSRACIIVSSKEKRIEELKKSIPSRAYHKVDCLNKEGLANILNDLLPINNTTHVSIPQTFFITTTNDIDKTNTCGASCSTYAEMEELCRTIFTGDLDAYSITLHPWPGSIYSNSLAFLVKQHSKTDLPALEYFLKITTAEDASVEIWRYSNYVKDRIPAPEMRMARLTRCECLGGLISILKKSCLPMKEIYSRLDQSHIFRHNTDSTNIEIGIDEVLTALSRLIRVYLYKILYSHTSSKRINGTIESALLTNRIREESISWLKNCYQPIKCAIETDEHITIHVSNYELKGPNIITFLTGNRDNNDFGHHTSLIHGDLHFRNMLFDIESKEAMLLDFESMVGGSPVLCDFAKMESDILLDLLDINVDEVNWESELLPFLDWQIGSNDLVLKGENLKAESYKLFRAARFIACIRGNLDYCITTLNKQHPDLFDGNELKPKYKQQLLKDYKFALLVENVKAFEWSEKKPSSAKMRNILSCFCIVDYCNSGGLKNVSIKKISGKK